MIHVLISEDDFRVAQIHENFIEKIEGMTLTGKALNAGETLTLLNQTHVDLILLDVYMPDALGTDLLHKIREIQPSVDIIMITAATQKNFLERAIHYGVQDYLIKPVTLEQFTTSMNRYKKKKQMLKEIDEVDENLLHQVFHTEYKKTKITSLPTGIDERTLSKIKAILEEEQDGITSEKAGDKIGASRTTARRYLEYLVGTEEAAVEQVYGIVGRPERRYYSITSS